MIKAVDWGTKLSTTSITYRFVPGNVQIQGPTGLHQTFEWSSYEKAQFVKAFALFSSFTNAKFSEDLSSGGGMLKLASIFKANSGDLGAFGPPGIGQGEGVGEFNWNGQGWHWNRPGAGGLEQGGLGFENILHEVGHGLGLSHPHDNGPGTSPVFYGVPEGQGFGAFGQHQHNQNIYTMMSYNKGWATGPAASKPSADFTYGQIGTPMAFDIAALQAKYGVNKSYRKGNDTYVLPDANKLGTFWMSIWDAGGNDTIQYNGTKSVVIDLRAATLAHAAGGGGYLSNAKGIAGGFTIANKVVIENATGGHGADTLRGNSANNVLKGNGGGDTMYGGAGNDRMYGGNHNDRMFGDSGNDRLYGDAGGDRMYGGYHNDFLFGGSGNDRLYGDAGSDRLYGGAHNDILFGGSGNDRVYGDAGGDKLYGGNHNDTLFGGAGADRLYGDAGADKLYGGNHNDVLFGGSGNDRLYGDAGADHLYGGHHNDVLFGGIGNDRLYGDAGADRLYGGHHNDLLFGGIGNDRLYGDAGNDRLYGGGQNDFLYGGHGNDRLYGDAGADRLYGGRGDDLLYGGAGKDYAHFSGKLSEYTITERGGRTIVSHRDGAGADGTDTLVGIEVAVFSDQSVVL